MPDHASLKVAAIVPRYFGQVAWYADNLPAPGDIEIDGGRHVEVPVAASLHAVFPVFPENIGRVLVSCRIEASIVVGQAYHATIRPRQNNLLWYGADNCSYGAF